MKRFIIKSATLCINAFDVIDTERANRYSEPRVMRACLPEEKALDYARELNAQTPPIGVTLLEEHRLAELVALANPGWQDRPIAYLFSAVENVVAGFMEGKPPRPGLVEAVLDTLEIRMGP